MKTLRRIASDGHFPVAMLLRAKAVDRLRPDLSPRILSGEIDLDGDGTRAEVWAAFWPLFSSQIEARQ
jgi:hypothetical protein